MYYSVSKLNYISANTLALTFSEVGAPMIVETVPPEWPGEPFMVSVLCLYSAHLIAAAPGLAGLAVLRGDPGVLQVHVVQLLQLAVGGAPDVVGELDLERVLALQHSLTGVLSI